MSNLDIRSSKSVIVILTILLFLAAVMMPVQIRPAAYNQRDPSLTSSTNQHHLKYHQQHNNNNNADLPHSNFFLEDDDYSEVDHMKSKDPETFLLSIYVVFHRMLDESLFSELALPDAVPDTEETSQLAPGKIKTGSILDVVLGGNKGVTFFATNKDIPKELNQSNPLFKNRVVEEWDTEGFQKHTGQQFGSAFNEFGAMTSIYYSGYTYRDWTPQTTYKSVELFASKARKKKVVLRKGAEDAFIGVLQYDMRLNDKVIRMLKQKIHKTRMSVYSKDMNSFSAGGTGGLGVNNKGLGAHSRWMRRGGAAAAVAAGDKNTDPEYHVQKHSRAVKYSKMHQQQQQQSPVDEAAATADITTSSSSSSVQKNSKCCVFYSIAYPMQSLIQRDDPFTKKLLDLYNLHFYKQYTYDDLTKFAILDAFVIPFSEFNKFVPFAENLMRNGVKDGALTSKEARAKALKQLEQALALFLGFMGKEGYQYVMMPLRHEPINRN